MAIRRPDLARALVIVDGDGFSARSAHERAFWGLMARPALLRAIYPAFARAYMRARTVADRRAPRCAFATMRRIPGLRAVSELWGSFRAPEHDLRADAGAITAPTLVSWGRRDPVISLGAERRIAGSIHGAQLAVLDSGHLPYTTDPDAFAAHLLPSERAQEKIAQPVDACASSTSPSSVTSRPSAVAVRRPTCTTVPSASTRPPGLSGRM